MSFCNDSWSPSVLFLSRCKYHVMYFNNYRMKRQQERLLFSAVSRDSWTIYHHGTLQHDEQAANNRPIALFEVDDNENFIIYLTDDHLPTSTACFWDHRACFSAISGYRRMFLIASRIGHVLTVLESNAFPYLYNNSWLLSPMITSLLSWYHHRKRPSWPVSHVICTWLSRVYDKPASEQLLSLQITTIACFSTCSQTASSPRTSWIALKPLQFTPFSQIFPSTRIIPTVRNSCPVLR